MASGFNKKTPVPLRLNRPTIFLSWFPCSGVGTRTTPLQRRNTWQPNSSKLQRSFPLVRQEASPERQAQVIRDNKSTIDMVMVLQGRGMTRPPLPCPMLPNHYN